MDKIILFVLLLGDMETHTWKFSEAGSVLGDNIPGVSKGTMS